MKNLKNFKQYEDVNESLDPRTHKELYNLQTIVSNISVQQDIIKDQELAELTKQLVEITYKLIEKSRSK